MRLCRLSIAATEENSKAKIASATFAIALTGSVDVAEATLTVKGTDMSAVKTKKSLAYPNNLDKALDLDPNSQLKVLSFSFYWYSSF